MVRASSLQLKPALDCRKTVFDNPVKLLIGISIVTGVISSVLDAAHRRRQRERVVGERKSSPHADQSSEIPHSLGHSVTMAILGWLPTMVLLVVVVAGIEDPVRRWAIAAALSLIAISVGAMWFGHAQDRQRRSESELPHNEDAI